MKTVAILPVCTLWHRTQHLVDTPQAVAFVIDLLCDADGTQRNRPPLPMPLGPPNAITTGLCLRAWCGSSLGSVIPLPDSMLPSPTIWI